MKNFWNICKGIALALFMIVCVWHIIDKINENVLQAEDISWAEPVGNPRTHTSTISDTEYNYGRQAEKKMDTRIMDEYLARYKKERNAQAKSGYTPKGYNAPDKSYVPHGDRMIDSERYVFSQPYRLIKHIPPTGDYPVDWSKLDY